MAFNPVTLILYESKFIESIVKEIADKLNLSRPHVPPSSVPLSSALRPLSYFFGLLREWRRGQLEELRRVKKNKKREGGCRGKAEV
ncbi:hypothetical protein NC653_012589 [Populus alba x Populus x berolinensis]|uniref:Uncharacterized protein n=1 Tax=Populus alba x Populus x berolinensis TaxID=444605 RepID=A0AAD6QSQ7_9ROSI|nr:hypothetical protein NC653_012589 [Populus alba x Populus x berolinensis]